jgi:hypothetical protein
MDCHLSIAFAIFNKCVYVEDDLPVSSTIDQKPQETICYQWLWGCLVYALKLSSRISNTNIL